MDRDACLDVLQAAAEMADAVRQGRHEEGFILCRSDGARVVRKGASCLGEDECLIDLPACDDGKPFASFHTHTTHDLQGKAAQAMLVPSAKDIEADRKAGVQVGCIGGSLNDGTGMVWCFPTDRDPKAAQSVIDRMGVAIQEHPFTIERKAVELLDEYLGVVGKPCSLLRFRL